MEQLRNISKHLTAGRRQEEAAFWRQLLPLRSVFFFAAPASTLSLICSILSRKIFKASNCSPPVTKKIYYFTDTATFKKFQCPPEPTHSCLTSCCMEPLEAQFLQLQRMSFLPPAIAVMWWCDSTDEIPSRFEIGFSYVSNNWQVFLE